MNNILPPNLPDEAREALFGDKLTQAIDAFGRAQTPKTTGDLCAELLGRVTSIINAAELRMLARLADHEGQHGRA